MRNLMQEHGAPRTFARALVPAALGISMLLLARTASADLPLEHPVPPQTIVDGSVVAECAWPSVVALYSNVGGVIERCTGFYIGGRVVLTAAHCVPRGFRVPPLGPTCQTDADCPTQDDFGQPLNVTCPSPGADVCEDPDPTLSNSIEAALFGEAYFSALSDGHIRRSVEIEYCRRRTDASGDSVAGTSNDIAYCVLRQEPNVQAVPIAMHCEVDQFFAEGTTVTAVGFGQADPAEGFESGGTKRAASATLPGDLVSASGTFHVFEDWAPGPPASGDSGGPLFAELPDGTWRAIGIASTNFVEYVTPWPHVQWILSDPNIDADSITPCHTETGEWEPKAGCGDFPASPGSAAGSWGRGPMACFNADVGGPSETCAPSGGATTGGFSSGVVGGSGDVVSGGVVDTDASPIDDSNKEKQLGCSCRSTSDHAPPPLWATAFLLLCLSRRRRRATSGAVVLVTVCGMLTGCPGDPGGTGTGSATDGGTDSGTGLPPPPPPLDPHNPDYQGILGGIDPDPTIDYTSLAVGNVREAVSSTNCCQDYVIASPSSSVVRIVFSEDLPGLTFLADVPDELVDVGGPGIDDVLLTDLDGDDRNDLVALRSDGFVAVVLGSDAGPPFFDEGTLGEFSAGSGRGSMVAEDLDCDGDVDLGITSPSTNGIVVFEGLGDGAFGALSGVASGSSPQAIAIGDANNDANTDVLVSNDNGNFSVLLNECGGVFEAAESYALIDTATPGMPIAVGNLCPGHPSDLAVAVGIFDNVYVICGDGSGSFSGVLEPHGEQFFGLVDYSWDPSSGNPPDQRITSLLVWQTDGSGTSALYTLRQSGPLSTSEVVWLPPDTSQNPSGEGRVLSQLQGGALFSEFDVHSVATEATIWNRIVFVGPPGLGATK